MDALVSVAAKEPFTKTTTSLFAYAKAIFKKPILKGIENAVCDTEPKITTGLRFKPFVASCIQLPAVPSEIVNNLLAPI